MKNKLLPYQKEILSVIQKGHEVEIKMPFKRKLSFMECLMLLTLDGKITNEKIIASAFFAGLKIGVKWKDRNEPFKPIMKADTLVLDEVDMDYKILEDI